MKIRLVYETLIVNKKGIEMIGHKTGKKMVNIE